jgi:hypothetical protein
MGICGMELERYRHDSDQNDLTDLDSRLLAAMSEAQADPPDLGREDYDLPNAKKQMAMPNNPIAT